MKIRKITTILAISFLVLLGLIIFLIFGFDRNYTMPKCDYLKGDTSNDCAPDQTFQNNADEFDENYIDILSDEVESEISPQSLILIKITDEEIDNNLNLNNDVDSANYSKLECAIRFKVTSSHEGFCNIFSVNQNMVLFSKIEFTPSNDPLVFDNDESGFWVEPGIYRIQCSTKDDFDSNVVLSRQLVCIRGE
ncbi:MAG TPA: hypothetical protein PJ997_01635 [Candidatus Paceibacterota bacterium]|nr:hypothetical protein [Candidatus Paceibacterota bacterium]HMP19019.1 hypothetical protein [Candidatus Paceibacterota bacterium]